MIPTSFPRISHPSQEGVLSVSKWLKHQVLLDPEEMEDLLHHLPPFFCCLIGQVVNERTAFMSLQDFLEKYTVYINALKRGEILPPHFTSIWTTSLDEVYALKVGVEKFILKPLKPTVQLQSHLFYYSTLDQKFHPMTMSKESISWGIQFSYPQIFEDPKTHLYSKVSNTPQFPNTELFLKLGRWLRAFTMPTPFLVEGNKVNVPIRIGKKVFSWIEHHPQLREKGLKVCPL